MFRNRVYIKRLIACLLLMVGVFVAAICYQDGYENETAKKVVNFSLADISLLDIDFLNFSFSNISFPDISIGTVLDAIASPFQIGSAKKETIEETVVDEDERVTVELGSVTDSEVDVSITTDLLDIDLALDTAEAKKRLASKLAYYVGAYFDFWKELIPEELMSIEKLKWYHEKIQKGY